MPRQGFYPGLNVFFFLFFGGVLQGQGSGERKGEKKI